MPVTPREKVATAIAIASLLFAAGTLVLDYVADRRAYASADLDQLDADRAFLDARLDQTTQRLDRLLACCAGPSNESIRQQNTENLTAGGRTLDHAISQFALDNLDLAESSIVRSNIYLDNVSWDGATLPGPETQPGAARSYLWIILLLAVVGVGGYVYQKHRKY